MHKASLLVISASTQRSLSHATSATSHYSAFQTLASLHLDAQCFAFTATFLCGCRILLNSPPIDCADLSLTPFWPSLVDRPNVGFSNGSLVGYVRWSSPATTDHMDCQRHNLCDNGWRQSMTSSNGILNSWDSSLCISCMECLMGQLLCYHPMCLWFIVCLSRIQGMLISLGLISWFMSSYLLRFPRTPLVRYVIFHTQCKFNND